MLPARTPNPGALLIKETDVQMFLRFFVAISMSSTGLALASDIFVDGFEFPLCNKETALEDKNPLSAAAAIELCGGVGDSAVEAARYTRANGTPWAHSAQGGITSQFGTHVIPRAGAHMLVLSSGHARDANDPIACGSRSCTGVGAGTAPAGFPQDVPGCPGTSAIHDDVAFELTLRAPQDAQGFAFDHRFFTFEYPEWVCTSFNDQFVVVMNPPPPGSISGNIVFDALLNPISVNFSYFDVCTGCALGNSELVGTGFDLWDGGINGAGGIRWLTTTAPVQGGAEFTLRFIIWDAGDASYDSTALIDNFRWRYEATALVTAPSE